MRAGFDARSVRDTEGIPADRGRRRARLRLLVTGLAMLLLALGVGSPAAARDDGADGRFEERRSSHFVLYQDVDIDHRGGFGGSVRFERDVLAVLESAYDQLDELLGLRPRRPISVVIYDPGLFDQQFRGLFRFPAAGFYQGVIRIRGETQVTVYLRRVLHHELVHAAFDAVAPSVGLPGWFNEGVAEWFEARAVGKRLLSGAELSALQRAARARALLPLRALSTPSFVHLGPNQAGLAYLQAYGMIEHLVRRHGERKLRDLTLETLRSRRLDRAFRRVYRFDLAELPEVFADDLGV